MKVPRALPVGLHLARVLDPVRPQHTRSARESHRRAAGGGLISVKVKGGKEKIATLKIA